MRLLIVGSLQGQIGAATKIAMDRGAKVTHAIDHRTGARRACAAGSGADLVMCDVTLDIGRLVRALDTERICTPVVACGIGTDARRGRRCDPRRRQRISAAAARRRSDRRRSAAVAEEATSSSLATKRWAR